MKKHAEERQRKIRRQNELKNGTIDVKMDDELGRKRAYSEMNNFDDFEDNMNDFSDFGVDFSEFDQSKTVEDSDYTANNLLKTETFQPQKDQFGFDASDALFEDLFSLKERVLDRMVKSIGSEWKSILR